ncbi:hypothetical protein niasHT_008951 [Heterodera trifolii]|uniref:Uncharacterized protein n=1 Tax=Heterodera trifolii TaxID=157864 RepID=A0ABD2LY89_9BILA
MRWTTTRVSAKFDTFVLKKQANWHITFLFIAVLFDEAVERLQKCTGNLSGASLFHLMHLLLLGFKLYRPYFVASTNGTDPGTFKNDFIRSDFAVLHIAPTAYNMEFFRIDMAIAREELLASSDIYFFQSCPETLDIDSDYFECD